MKYRYNHRQPYFLKEKVTSLKIQLAPKNKRGLELANPVMTASGTFGYGVAFQGFFDIERLGAIVCKGTTLEPKAGNLQPRIAETSCGLLNSIGLQNAGVNRLVQEKAPIWAKWHVPVIVNIAGESVGDYARLAQELDTVPGIAALEVNISCPNVAEGGAAFGTDADAAAKVTVAVREATTLPIIVKLSPNVTDITEIARAVASAGADAISLINTLKGMAIDIHRRQPLLGNITGGLSGPAIKPVALYMVYEVAKAVGVPVVGLGGIVTAADALEFIMAGATAIEVGSASLRNPRAALDVLEGIERFMADEGIEDINKLVGVARR
ncbi:MAG: dihydroorotate dehydrogenase [Chloroflexota bacterium]